MTAGAFRWILEAAKNWIGSTTSVPADFTLFPADISRPPREWAERFFNVQRWTEMPTGGHFAAMEETSGIGRGHQGVLQALSNLAVTSAPHVSRRRNPRRSPGAIHRVADRRNGTDLGRRLMRQLAHRANGLV